MKYVVNYLILLENNKKNLLEKWIKIKQDSFDFILFSLEEEYNKDELAEDPCYKFQLFNIIKELKSQQK